MTIPPGATFGVDESPEVKTKAPATLRAVGGEKAKTTPPRVEEWQDWFSRVVLRLGTDWYISQAFRGIDEELLTSKDLEALKLRSEERDQIAKPFAEFANKFKWTRKHGRAIIASTGSIESLIALGQWVSRVNRISRKFRRQQAKQQQRSEYQEETVYEGTTGQEPFSDGPRQTPPPESNGHGNFRIYSPGTG